MTVEAIKNSELQFISNIVSQPTIERRFFERIGLTGERSLLYNWMAIEGGYKDRGVQPLCDLDINSQLSVSKLEQIQDVLKSAQKVVMAAGAALNIQEQEIALNMLQEIAGKVTYNFNSLEQKMVEDLEEKLKSATAMIEPSKYAEALSAQFKQENPMHRIGETCHRVDLNGDEMDYSALGTALDEKYGSNSDWKIPLQLAGSQYFLTNYNTQMGMVALTHAASLNAERVQYKFETFSGSDKVTLIPELSHGDISCVGVIVESHGRFVRESGGYDDRDVFVARDVKAFGKSFIFTQNLVLAKNSEGQFEVKEARLSYSSNPVADQPALG